jgi:hypothetical protein
MVYEYIRQDNGFYRILAVPLVYSQAYYQYIHYLSNSFVTFSHGYGIESVSELQKEVYESVRRGNLSSDIGEKMALLGIKYLVYNYYYSKSDSIVARLNETNDLEFMLKDKGYILYRNKRFDDTSVHETLIHNAGFENGTAEWAPWNKNEGLTVLDSTTFHSGYASMKCVSTDVADLAGRITYFYPSNLTANEFTLSGWSKAENVVGQDTLYAIRANVVYHDGSTSSGAYADFSSGTHNWEYSSVTFATDPSKEIQSIIVSLFLRNGLGTVWFDDISLMENRIADNWNGVIAVRKLNTDTEALLSEENKADATASLYRESSMAIRLHFNVSESCYIILSESYNKGWQIHPENAGEVIDLENYRDLITLHFQEPGTYSLTLEFATYFEFLRNVVLFQSLATITIALFGAFSMRSDLRRLVRPTCKSRRAGENIETNLP